VKVEIASSSKGLLLMTSLLAAVLGASTDAAEDGGLSARVIAGRMTDPLLVYSQ